MKGSNEREGEGEMKSEDQNLIEDGPGEEDEEKERKSAIHRIQHLPLLQNSTWSHRVLHRRAAGCCAVDCSTAQRGCGHQQQQQQQQRAAPTPAVQCRQTDHRAAPRASSFRCALEPGQPTSKTHANRGPPEKEEGLKRKYSKNCVDSAAVEHRK